MGELFKNSVNLKIIRCVNDYNMFVGQSAVLAAFSGGADSVAMLGWLTEYCLKNNLRLAALHVNHKIRGDEAERDAAFCENFCRVRGVEFYYREVNVPALAAVSGQGLEEAAREIRYSELYHIAKKHGFDCIATAHNADDNLETVIFNLARGTSAAGLAGIPPVRRMTEHVKITQPDNTNTSIQYGHESDPVIIRPLLYCEKTELIAYCRETELEYVTDSTNADTAYTRNFIRAEIIPRLERVNSAVRRNALRMCKSLRADDDEMNAAAAHISLVGGRTMLAMQSDAVLFRVLQREFGNYTGGGTLEYTHLEKIAELLRSGKKIFYYSLPRLTQFKCEGDALSFGLDPRGAIQCSATQNK